MIILYDCGKVIIMMNIMNYMNVNAEDVTAPIERCYFMLFFCVLFSCVGFSLGDELGLAESLGNLEGNKRRSLSQRDSLAINNIGVFPAAKLTVSFDWNYVIVIS